MYSLNERPNAQLPILRTWVDLPPEFQEYVRIQGSSAQLVQFMALAEGIKPALDDWVQVERLDAFQRMAHRFGLLCEIDSIFEYVQDETELASITGGNKLNTTRSRGHLPNSRFEAGAAQGAAHVFISKDQQWLAGAVAHGWYPLVMDQRVIQKPWMDHYWFGYYLGYPNCCRHFFARHNEWNSDNSYYHAFRASRSLSYLCNSLLKGNGLSYAVHLPCSFCCEATATYAREVRSHILSICRPLAEEIDRLLRLPYLVLSEWELFGLVGKFDAGNRVSYEEVFIAPTNRPDIELYNALSRGDAIEVELDIIRVYKGREVISTRRARSDRFGPQVPLLLNFAD